MKKHLITTSILASSIALILPFTSLAQSAGGASGSGGSGSAAAGGSSGAAAGPGAAGATGGASNSASGAATGNGAGATGSASGTTHGGSTAGTSAAGSTAGTTATTGAAPATPGYNRAMDLNGDGKISNEERMRWEKEHAGAAASGANTSPAGTTQGTVPTAPNASGGGATK